MPSLYTITSDLEAIKTLMESAVDTDGNPRPLTDTEEETLKNWFTTSADEFYNKVDSYCKLIKNEKIHAENVDDERKNYKAELDRLSARAKVYSNHADSLKKALYGAMVVLGIPKVKTELFTLGIQNTAMKVEPRAGSDLSKVPSEYLKPRELDTTAIKAAIKTGILTVREEEGGRVYDEDGNWIEGIFVTKSETLVIR